MRGEPSHEALVQGETAGEEMERLGMAWTGSGPDMLGWRRGGLGCLHGWTVSPSQVFCPGQC